jgi:hypothetical protein
MPSQLNVDTLVAANGTDPVTLTKQSAAKAWYKSNSAIVFSGTFNIASGVDNGTGNYTFNFTNSMADTDYTTPCGCQSGNDRGTTLSALATGSITMESYNYAGTNTDASTMASVHGDLA